MELGFLKSNEIPDEFKCPICFLATRTPHQTVCCGNIICGFCIKKCSSNCPICRHESYRHFEDKHHARRLSELVEVKEKQQEKAGSVDGIVSSSTEHIISTQIEQGASSATEKTALLIKDLDTPTQRRELQFRSSENCLHIITPFCVLSVCLLAGCIFGIIIIAKDCAEILGFAWITMASLPILAVIVIVISLEIKYRIQLWHIALCTLSSFLPFVWLVIATIEEWDETEEERNLNDSKACNNDDIRIVTIVFTILYIMSGLTLLRFCCKYQST